MDMPIKCMIVEDEPLAQDKIRGFVEKLPYLELVAVVDNGADALVCLKSQPVDLVLLDINMGEFSGIRLLESAGLTAEVIIITAHHEYAIRGFELNVTDYLLKPFTFERFVQAVEKAQQKLAAKAPVLTRNFIFIKTEYRLEKLMLGEIVYIEGMRDYRKVVAETRQIMTLQTFRDLEQEIPPAIICRVHKSFMVSLDKIDNIERDTIAIRGRSIPISDSYKKTFYRLIGSSLRLLLICLSFIAGVLHTAIAQLGPGLNRDSLRRTLQAEPEDTGKVQTFILLGQQYESNMPDSALWYYGQARTLSEQLSYPSGFLRYVSNYTAVLNVKGRFEESLKLNLEAIDTSRKYGMARELVKALHNTGVVYQYKEDYVPAVKYYLQVLDLIERSGDDRQLSVVYGNLTGLFRQLQQPDRAMTYAVKALQFAERTGDAGLTGSACNNLGNALKDHNRFDESLVCFERAYKTGLTLDDINMQETALINQGDVYMQKGQESKSLASFRRALPFAVSLEDIAGQALILKGIALDLFRQKEFRPAYRQLSAAMAFAKQHDQKEVLSQSLLLMSDIHIALGSLDSARAYREAYDSLSNRLLNAGLLKNIQELETKYEVEKGKRTVLEKSLLLEQKNRESLHQRILLYAITAGAALLALLLFLGYRAYRQRQQLNVKEMEALRSEQENVRLKALIDGQQQERRRISQEIHDDIGSGLTSMVFLSRMVQERSEAAVRIRSNAEDLMKKMNEIIWTLNHEEDSLDSLVAYIRVTTADALETAGIAYRFDVTDPLPAIQVSQEVRRNVYLVVKEAVHNIIKHARAGNVHISIQADSYLQIGIRDDGIGLDGVEGRRFGNGLRNMRRRVEHIRGELTIGGTEGPGTVVSLTVPLPV